MKRRDVLTRATGVAMAPLIALPIRAQQPARPVSGFLGGTRPAPQIVKPFLDGLAEAGFSDGHNVTIEFRWAHDQVDRLPALASDLLRSQLAVMVTSGGLIPARAAKAATTSVPIVFAVGRDPVADGLVASLNRPGGNVTGVYMFTAALNAKRLELLHEMVPRVATIAILINPMNAGAQSIESEVRTAAATARVQLLVLHASTGREIEAAFKTLTEKRIGALIVSNDAFFNSQREQLVALATRLALPSIFEWREFATSGGLMSYGTDLAGVHRQLGAYAARILKGAKPADLPVIQPTRVELVINRKSARTLGLTIPRSLLARADEVIE